MSFQKTLYNSVDKPSEPGDLLRFCTRGFNFLYAKNRLSYLLGYLRDINAAAHSVDSDIF